MIRQKIPAPSISSREIQAGVQLDRTVREKYPASGNYALQAYVASVGKKISAVSGSNYPFTFTVLDDKRTANAFSGPGGFVYVTTGLLNMLDSESQLACVLGHETGHVIRHHVIKQMQERNRTNLILAVISKITNLNQQLSQLGEYVLLQKFSRNDEYEADQVGMELAAAANYNPHGMVEVLNKLNALESRGVAISFLQSHPSSAARARLAEEFYCTEPPGTSGTNPGYRDVSSGNSLTRVKSLQAPNISEPVEGG